MGGHGNGHGQSFEVPSPDIYKVENVPELKKFQEQLAARGLKDPWLRNEVWRFTHREPVRYKRILKGIIRGTRIGVPAFLITIAIEQYLGIDYGHGHSSHNGGHGNDGHH
ncbi:NADH dehydrogenase [ubiquinone] 1 beta subcomplex subunit 3 [Andrena cerasifolii]|uniref:NADH dehydrogenase [ubiquinone] 1 beta subcomplex subunit 3 n=1 Tax=Andrena cerasifolii TaxID=2819439 RepID=UPI0040376CEA